MGYGVRGNQLQLLLLSPNPLLKKRTSSIVYMQKDIGDRWMTKMDGEFRINIRRGGRYAEEKRSMDMRLKLNVYMNERQERRLMITYLYNGGKSFSILIIYTGLYIFESKHIPLTLSLFLSLSRLFHTSSSPSRPPSPLS